MKIIQYHSILFIRILIHDRRLGLHQADAVRGQRQQIQHRAGRVTDRVGSGLAEVHAVPGDALLREDRLELEEAHEAGEHRVVAGLVAAVVRGRGRGRAVREARARRRQLVPQGC